MKKAKVFIAVLIGALAAVSSRAQVNVPDGFDVEALGQNFAGGFDYLPNGDIIGMYVDPAAAASTYIGIIDANGDGTPAALAKVYDFGEPLFGAFVKVSPDGEFVLFLESSNYRMYYLDLSSYTTAEIVPSSGSLDGAFDLAFIDGDECYISANPSFGTTNEIYHLDRSLALREVAKIDGTFSGGIDVSETSDLYYVRNMANFPPQPGDYSVHRFDAARLAAVLAGAPTLGIGDSTEIASGLDGGYDIAWHSSGALYVSDVNNGSIYRIASVSDFATLGSGIGGGFSILALYRRDGDFSAGTFSGARLAAGYSDVFGGPSPLNIYQISSDAPPVRVRTNKAAYSAGDGIEVNIDAQPVQAGFDAYVVFVSPSGAAYSYTPGGVAAGIAPLTSAPDGLPQPYSGTIATLTVPQGAPAGAWKVYAAILRAGAEPKAANALALGEAGFTIE